jgi:glycine/serine hydroxymethyltransferase
MNKRIKTYEDLLQEEQRLNTQLASYKEVIKEDIAGVKSSLNPVKRIAYTAKNLFTFDDNGPLLNFGLRFGTDVFLRRLLLGRANWVAKVVVPYLIKNYASHLITEGQRKAVAKSISRLLSKFMMKKKKEPFEAAPPA